MNDNLNYKIHKYLNKEIDKITLLKRLNDDELSEWKETIQYIEELPELNFDTEAEYAILKQKIENKIKPKFNFIKIAAVIILLLTSTFLVRNYLLLDQDIVAISSLGQNQKPLLLPDGSEVTLNSTSSITYYTDDWKNSKRKLKLDGEAYFDVKEGQNFSVVTDNGTVTVLGTTFNVTSKDNNFKATCFSGKVKVIFENKEFVLKPGQSIDNETKKINFTELNQPKWISNKFIFKNVPLEKLIQDVEILKTVKINIKIEKELKFTGSYTNDMTTSEILDLVCQSLDLSYTKVDDTHFKIMM